MLREWKLILSRLGVCAALLASAALALNAGIVAAGDDGGDAPNRSSILNTSISKNWAGYAVQTGTLFPQSGKITRVYGEWTVPAVECRAGETSYSSVWVGLDGYDNGTVEQVGTQQNCTNGEPTYRSFYEMYPESIVPQRMNVKPGDVVQGEVTYSRGTFTMTLKNTTTDQRFSVKRTGDGARRSAEWIVETPTADSGLLLNLANFGSVEFRNTSVTVDGETGDIGDSRWKDKRLTMVNLEDVSVALTSFFDKATNSLKVTMVKIL